MLPFVIPTGAGAIAKFFLGAYSRKTTIVGLPAFLKTLRGDGRGDRGILTVSNHISVIDEPMMWGKLPISTFWQPRNVRWTLGASDIMFTTPFTRWFFRKGQVIETLRGKGIYQEAVDLATQKLNEGKWVNIFPEGRIKQDDLSVCRRFRWGVSRILIDAEVPPIIVPIWIEGFDQAMSERRSPINEHIDPLLREHRLTFPIPWRPATYNHAGAEDMEEEPAGLKEARIRIAAVLKEQVEKLGREQNKG